MIEYALIAVLVIVGIVIMGPYVLRSVGAHFKLWDEGVQDSFTENLTQAPVNDVPNVPTNCTCTTAAGSCGSPNSQCAVTQRGYAHLCNPQGCDGAPASSCVNDPSCCTAWVPMGCGTVPLGQPPVTTNCGSTQCNCNYGYQIQSQQCGVNNSIQCIQDSACPLPTCLGILSPGSLVCTNEPPVNGVQLTQNIGYTHVSDATACNAPCQYYCDTVNSFFFSGTSCSREFQVAICVDSTGYGCTTTPSRITQIDVNNQSFTICAPSQTTIITAVSITDISVPETAPYCNNPGNLGEECEITVSY
jgi:hypothetical protein